MIGSLVRWMDIGEWASKYRSALFWPETDIVSLSTYNRLIRCWILTSRRSGTSISWSYWHRIRCRVSKDFHYSNDITAIFYGGKPLSMYINGNKGRTYNDSNIFQPLNGFQIFIHNPNEFLTQSSYNTFQGFEHFNIFKILPEINLIADELKSWPIQKRNCLLHNERKLKHFRIYTKNNCELECLSLAADEACGCVPFYLILKSQKKLLCKLFSESK